MKLDRHREERTESRTAVQRSHPNHILAKDPETFSAGRHRQESQRLVTRAQQSVKEAAAAAYAHMGFASAGLCAVVPLLWMAWTWAYPQAFDSLALRLGIGALCLPLVWYRHWPRACAGIVPAYWALILTVALPWHGTLLMVANGYGQVWVLNLLAGAALLMVLQPWGLAVATFVVGSVAGLLSAPALMHLHPELIAPEARQTLTHLLALCIAALLGLKLVRSGARADSALTGGRAAEQSGDRPMAERRMSDLMALFVNNSVVQRLRTLETEEDPAKARRVINARGQRFCSMMHADIRGFTRIVNASNELEVAELVAQAFAEVTSVGQDLSVVKGTGDGLFLYSEGDAPIEEAATHVLSLASLFVSGVANVNQTMAIPRGLPAFSVGVGLHAGETVHGNFGGPGLVDITVMGRNVNLTQRLEELTKDQAVQRMLGTSAILMSEDFVTLLRKAGLRLAGLRALDLVEMNCRVRDFPAINRLWGLNLEQVLAFADQARQIIKAARQVKARVEPVGAKSGARSGTPRASVPPHAVAPETPEGEMSREELLGLLGVSSAASPVPGPSGPKGPSEGFSLDGITLESLINEASAAVVYVDKNWVARYCNATMAANLGLRPEQVIGRTPFEYTPTDFRRSIFYDACVTCAEESRPVSQIGYSTVLSRWLSVNLFPVSGGALLIAFEATASALKAYHLETANAPDPLTGLRNKLALEQHILATVSRHESLDLVLLSLRRFRAVNEAHGYAAGDMVLMQLGSRLQSASVLGEAVFRVSGDVFACVITRPAASSESAGEPERVLERCRQLLTLLQTPVMLEGYRIHLNVSIGVASSPRDGVEFHQLLRRADLALAEASRFEDSRLPIAVFEPALEEMARSRFSLDQDLRQCLDGSQFELVLQPRIHLATGSVTAAEALLRWNHPKRGPLSPSEFFPVARRDGDVRTMREIDTWVLSQVLVLCRRLSDFGETFPISCNLSSEVLGDVLFCARLGRDLAAAGVPPNLLEIEIKEGDLMLDAQASLRTLQTLKQIGVRLAIDHFGTGYPSSFSHLSVFPVDTIKVDRSFLAGLGGKGPNAKFVSSVAKMAHSLRLDVVADGVETESQVRKLHSLNFDAGQGFALAPPMTWDECMAFAAIRRIASDSKPNPFTI